MRHAKYNSGFLVSRALTAVFAVFAASSAGAGGFSYRAYKTFTTPSTPYTVGGQLYGFDVIEYRNNAANRNDIPQHCINAGYNGGTLPVFLVFGGGNGNGGGVPYIGWAGPSSWGSEYTVFDGGGRLGDVLMNKACTRVVYVRSVFGYELATSANASNPQPRMKGMAQNIASAMDILMQDASLYQQAKKVTYLGGSASALYGAHVLSDKFGQMVGPSASAPWNKVKRFVLAGPHGGNIITACKHNYAPADRTSYVTATAKNLVNWYCDELRPVPSSNEYLGNMYSPATQEAKAQAAQYGLRINMFVGDKDEIYGYAPGNNCIANGTCWSGPDGLNNFVNVANLTPINTFNNPTDGLGGAIFSGQSITKSILPGVNHSGVWTHPPTVKTICYLAAYDSLSNMTYCNTLP